MSHVSLQSCIQACNDCAVACDHCAASCLAEKDVQKLTRCFSLNLDCASICRTAVEFMGRGSEFAVLVCENCVAICDACAEECEQHSQMEHCRQCAQACRKCAEECRRMVAAVPMTVPQPEVGEPAH